MDPFAIIQGQLSQLNDNFNEAIRGFQQDIVNLSRRIDLLEGRQNQEVADINSKLIEVQGRLGGLVRYQERHFRFLNGSESPDSHPSQALNNFHFKKESPSVTSVKSVHSFTNESNMNQFHNVGGGRSSPGPVVQRNRENENTKTTAVAQILTNIKPVVNSFPLGKSVSMVSMVPQSHALQHKFPSDISVNLAQQLPGASPSLIQENSTTAQNVQIVQQPQSLNGSNSVISHNSMVMIGNPTPSQTQPRAGSAPPMNQDAHNIQHQRSQTGTPVNITHQTHSPQHNIQTNQGPYPLVSNEGNLIPTMNKTTPSNFFKSTSMQPQSSTHSINNDKLINVQVNRPPEALDAEMGADEVSHWNKIEFETLNPVPQSVHDVLEEWESGYRGQPPLKYMERYRKAWRKGNKNLSKKFCRRHRVVTAVEVGVAIYMKEDGLSYGEAKDKTIKELEETRARDDGKKETMYWLFHNIPQHLKKISVSESSEE